MPSQKPIKMKKNSVNQKYPTLAAHPANLGTYEWAVYTLTAEPANLYLKVGANAPISVGKAGITYKGIWNATSNAPAIVSSVGTTGDYYIVGVAGATTIDGISDWAVNDWVIFSGTTWQKIDNSESDVEWVDILNKPATFPPSAHGHTIADVSSLQSSLDAKASITYVDGLTTNVRRLIGDLNCSANPNYPAATKGDSYQVSVAGKIGGASGVNVNVGDEIVCKTTNAGGIQGNVGTSWYVLESNREQATLSTLGLVQRASVTEVRTGTNQDKYVAPNDLTSGLIIGAVSYPKTDAELDASYPNAKNGQMVTAYTASVVVGFYLRGFVFAGNPAWQNWLYFSEADTSDKVDISGDTLTGLLKFATALWDSADTSIPNYEVLKDYVSSKISVTILASMPATLPFTGQTRIGSKTSPLTDLTIPAPAASPIEGAYCLIYLKRDDAQIPFFNSAEYEDFSCPFIQGVVNEIIVRYSGGKYSCSSSQKLANPSASSLLITSLFNFGAYTNYLEGDTLTANATATISPTWTWLSATDAAGAGEATLATGQTRVVAGTEAFITFKVVGRSGMFNGDEVKLTPFKPVKSISEDTNWSSDYISTNGTFPTTNARFARSTGNSNAPTLISGTGVGFSGNHISIVSSTTGASKLYFTFGGTTVQPQIPSGASTFYFFEVEIWCNADKDLRFRMDDAELFSEWYQDGNYGAAVTPTVFRAFNTVVTKRIIVKHTQSSTNSRFSVETTGTGTIGDELRLNIKRAGLISA